jgi:hypothetical protein
VAVIPNLFAESSGPDPQTGLSRPCRFPSGPHHLMSLLSVVDTGYMALPISFDRKIAGRSLDGSEPTCPVQASMFSDLYTSTGVEASTYMRRTEVPTPSRLTADRSAFEAVPAPRPVHSPLKYAEDERLELSEQFFNPSQLLSRQPPDPAGYTPEIINIKNP